MPLDLSLENDGLGLRYILSVLVPYINALPSSGTPNILQYNTPQTPVAGDGLTNSTAAFQAAAAANQPIFLPLQTSFFSTTLQPTQLPFRMYGEGIVQDGNANKRGRYFSQIKQAPSSLGNTNSVETAFNGDWSHVPFPVEHRITGAATLGLPATGYRYTPEATPHYTYTFNSSGHNESNSTNVGRTAAVITQNQGYQHGQGDMMAFSALMFGDTTNPTATDVLACPAISILAGQTTAGISHMYLNPVEIDLADNGFDVAGAAFVSNLNRTNSAAALHEFWYGIRLQSIGTQPVDVMYSATGQAKFGLDVSNLTLDANAAAIALKQNQRIYLNVTPGTPTPTVSNDWMGYSSIISGLVVTIGNHSSLQVNSGQVTANADFAVVGKVGFYSTLPANQQTILGSRASGAALTDLLTKLALTGIVIDGTTA